MWETKIEDTCNHLFERVMGCSVRTSYYVLVTMCCIVKASSLQVCCTSFMTPAPCKLPLMTSAPFISYFYDHWSLNPPYVPFYDPSPFISPIMIHTPLCPIFWLHTICPLFTPPPRMMSPFLSLQSVGPVGSQSCWCSNYLQLEVMVGEDWIGLR